MVSKDSNSGETTLQESMVAGLIKLYEEDCSGPFPYADCRKLLASGLAGQGLIPDLDLYFYDIASHCGGARKILKWSREQLLEARLKLGESFFERHPQYRPIQTMILESTTPELYADLVLHERMRMAVLKLLSSLLSDKPGDAAGDD